MTKRIIIILGLLISASIGFAQEFDISASFSKDTIIIGEQIELSIQAKLPKNVELIFPEYKDTISKEIEIILDSEHTLIEEDAFNIYNKNLLVTSFDTGINVVASIPVMIVEGNDTNYYSSGDLRLVVKPFVLLDTIPVDTIYSNRAGFVVFGKDGFEKEIEKYIPDSIKQSLSTDSLAIVKESLREQLFQLFSSEVTEKTGIYDQDQIMKISESSSQKMYLVDKGGVAEEFLVAGSVDTVFVQVYQKVQQNQALFTLYKIKDINEEMYETPFTLAELWYYFKKYLKMYWWILVLVILVVIGLLYYILFYKQDKKPTFIKVKPKLPAHIIALEKLEIIRKEKIWSNGQIKEFHVQVTDTVREYIENRYGIFAIEMTTSEIVQSFEGTSYLTDIDFIKMKQMLELADAVKFAKYQALQNENDLSMRNAIEFVENTKEVLDIDNKDKQVEAEIELDENVKPVTENQNNDE